MPDHSLFRLRILPWCIALAMSGSYSSVWAEDDIQFDSRFLELKGDPKGERPNGSFTQWSVTVHQNQVITVVSLLLLSFGQLKSFSERMFL